VIYTLDGLSHVRAAAARARVRPHVVIRVAGTSGARWDGDLCICHKWQKSCNEYGGNLRNCL